MIRFQVINKHGLRFTMFARDRRHACATLCRILGKRSLPEYIGVYPG